MKMKHKTTVNITSCVRRLQYQRYVGGVETSVILDMSCKSWASWQLQNAMTTGAKHEKTIMTKMVPAYTRRPTSGDSYRCELDGIDSHTMATFKTKVKTDHRHSGTLKVGGPLVADILYGKQPYTCIMRTITPHGISVDEVSGGNILESAKATGLQGC